MTSFADRPDFLAPEGFASQLIYGGSVNAAAAQKINVSQYGAVVVELYCAVAGTPLVAGYQFLDSSSNYLLDSGLLTSASLGGVNGQPIWILPVSGPILSLAGNSSLLLAQVTGISTRRAKQMASDFQPSILLSGSVPASVGAGVLTQMTISDPNTLTTRLCLNSTNFNGPCYFSVSASAALTGVIQAQLYDQNAAMTFRSMFTNPSTAGQNILAGHPFGFVRWEFNPTATTPATPTSVFLIITPAYSPLP